MKPPRLAREKQAQGPVGESMTSSTRETAQQTKTVAKDMTSAIIQITQTRMTTPGSEVTTPPSSRTLE